MKINLFIIFLVYFALNVFLIIKLSRKVTEKKPDLEGKLNEILAKTSKDTKIISCLLIALNITPILFIIYLIMKNKVKMKNVNVL